MDIKKDSTDITVYFHLRNSSDGTSKTGLVYNSAGAVASYTRERGLRTAISLATLAAADSAHADGGFKEVDGTNEKGLYRFDIPDAAFATGVQFVIMHIGFTGVFEESLQVDLVDNIVKDVYDIAAHTDYGNAKLVRVTTPANKLDIEAGGTVGLDFSNTNGTHPTVPTVTDVTNDVGITQAGADKVWGTAARTLTSFGTLIADIWANATRTLSSFGTLIADVADQVWDEALSAHAGAGSFGVKNQKAVPSEVINDYKADVSSLATSAALSTVDTVVDAIKAVTDNLPNSGALNDLATILTDTNELQTDWTNSGRLDLLLDAIKAVTDNLRLKKNTAVANFPIFMVLTSDHVTGATGKTVAAQRSIDGGAFSGCANSVSEVANGMYKINLAASDLNGDTITLKFTNTDCDARIIPVVTVP